MPEVFVKICVLATTKLVKITRLVFLVLGYI